MNYVILKLNNLQAKRQISFIEEMTIRKLCEHDTVQTKECDFHLTKWFCLK